MSSELSETSAPPESPALPAPAWAPLDWLLLGLLLVLAFLLGAFRATNNDLYFHFAVGKLLGQRGYSFGVDPFSWTTEGQYWVNHAWLYAWSIHAYFQAFGGPALVALHASFVVMMTLLLWAARPRDVRWLTATEAIGLCVLVASPRFGVQPATLSLVFWAGLLAVLFRAGILGHHPEPLGRRLWILPPLFLLWANVDVGFMFGLLLLGLCLCAASPHRALLGRVTLACLLACCLNPHHVRVFTLPPELSYILVSLHLDLLPAAWVDAGRTLHGLYVPAHYLLHSPLSSTYLNLSGQSVAGLLYFLVLMGYLASQAALVVLSIRVRQPVPWAGALAGGVFTLLSLMLARLIPWFAVLAAPLFLHNLAALARLKPMPAPSWPGVLRITALLFFAVGIVLAIPGWLHSNKWDAFAPRRVAFAVHENQPLRRLAERLAAEKPARVLSLNLDFPAYLAYFGSGTKSYMDTRFELFAKQAGTFRELRKSLDDDAKNWSDRPFWQEEAEREGIDVIAFTEGFTRGGELAPMLLRFWSRNEDWPMLYGDGAAQAFARRTADRPRGPDLRDAWTRRAFGRPAGPPPAIPTGKQGATSVADIYWGRVAQLQESTAEPWFLAEYYEFERKGVQLTLQIAAREQHIGVGLQGLTAGPVAAVLHTLGLGAYFNAYQMPELPVLAVQESLRLTKIAPEPFPIQQGPEPNMVLARGYGLLFHTVEGPWLEYRRGMVLSSALQNWRRYQTAAAANRAMVEAIKAYHPVTPENILQILEPRDALRRVLQEFNYIDADVNLLESMILQATQVLQSNVQKSPRLAFRIDEWEKEKRRIEPTLRKRSDEYELSVADFRAETPENQFIRHLRAESLGLATVALENLEKIKITEEMLKQEPIFCGRILLATAQIYMRFGRTSDVFRLIDENLQAADVARQMGALYYAYLGVFTKSCLGFHAEADQILHEQIEKRFPPREIFHRTSRRDISLYAVKSQLDVAATLLAGGIPLGGLHDLHRAGGHVLDVNILPEVRMFRGLLALEQGLTREALRHFEAALEYDWPDNYFPERGVIRNYRNLLKKQLEK